MGWGYCGINSVTGEEMGYSVTGVCSFSGCNKEIDHGLSFVCGGMHEGGECGCGRYFCTEHLTSIDPDNIEAPYDQVCYECRDAWEKDHKQEEAND